MYGAVAQLATKLTDKIKAKICFMTRSRTLQRTKLQLKTY